MKKNSSASRQNPGTPSRSFVLWSAWVLLIFFILGAILYWGIVRLPKSQHAAARVELELIHENDQPQEQPQYGLAVYKQAAEVRTTHPPLYVVMDGVGLHHGLSIKAMDVLPRAVTLAYSPYGVNVAQEMQAAWEKGHELLLQAQFQSMDGGDRGPLMLRADATFEKNMHNLDALLGSGKAFVGVITTGRSQMVASREDILPVLSKVSREGLLFLDASLSVRSLTKPLSHDLHLPHVQATAVLGARMTPHLLEEELLQVRHLLKNKQPVVLVVELTSLTLATLEHWLTQNKDLFQLRPISARLEDRSL